MSLLDLLKGNYERHVADWTPLRPQASRCFNETHAQVAGVTVNVETAMNSGTAMACTRSISETLASLPAVVIEQMGANERRKARENPMWALLHDQPNPSMDSMVWYEVNCNRVVNRGNAVSVIEFNGRGIPIALWPVHNSRFSIFRRRSQQVASGRFFPGEVFYRIWPDETERHYDVPSDEVLNVVGWDTEDGLIGRGVVRRAKQEIGLDLAEQEFVTSAFKNGALPLGLIKHPWMDDPEQREALRSDLNSVHSGRENWNKLGILWDKDADWVKLGFSPADVEAIPSRMFTAKALCRYYGVPPAIVQIFDDYKFSTIEAMLKHFIMLTVRPYAVRFERAINSQVLRGLVDESLFLEFALEGLLRGDPETQAKTNQIYRSMGALNADEIRQRDLGMNPLPDGLGEVLLAPLNHGPLELIAEGGNMKGNDGGGSTQQQPGGNGSNDGDGSDDVAAAEHPAFDKAWLAALLQHTTNQRCESPQWAVSSRRHFAKRVLADRLGHMIRVEQQAVRRQIDKGSAGFLGWVDEYYDRFTATLLDGIKVGCEGLDEDSPELLASCLADAHVARSKQLIFDATECSREEFAEQLNDCISAWDKRSTGGLFESWIAAGQAEMKNHKELVQ